MNDCIYRIKVSIIIIGIKGCIKGSVVFWKAFYWILFCVVSHSSHRNYKLAATESLRKEMKRRKLLTWFSLLSSLSWSLMRLYLADSSLRRARSFFSSGLQNVLMECIEEPNFWFVNSNSFLRFPSSRCKSLFWCCNSPKYGWWEVGDCRADLVLYGSSSKYRLLSSERSRLSLIGRNSRSWSTVGPLSRDWYLTDIGFDGLVALRDLWWPVPTASGLPRSSSIGLANSSSR